VLLRLLKGVATDVNCLSNSGQEGGEDETWAGLQDCETDRHAVDRRMLCSWCSANRPLSFTSMSAVARQSHVQATLACTTTVYPYSSPVSPDVDVCCVAGWRLMFCMAGRINFYLGMLISFFSKNRLSYWKNRFFFDYRIWVSLTVGRSKTCWDAVTDAGTVVARPPGTSAPTTATAGNNPGFGIGQVLHVLVIA